jgi:glycosyltransferase involved in cell wall biosynthesis
MRVAHIVYPVERMAPRDSENPEVVQRPARAPRRDVLGKLGETRGVWRALAKADARAYVFRTGLSGGIAAFTVGALFCMVRRRRLFFAASNDLDFILGRSDRSRLTERLYQLALKRATRVVVQSEQQLELTRKVVDDGRATLIPSFTEPASVRSPPGDDAPLLWVGRVIEYKLPLSFVDLAQALPEARFRMVAFLTGESPPALSEQLDKASQRAPNLEVVPQVRREQVLEWIARCTAVVSTSRYEGMPNVFLEAWTRGVPVISLHFDPDDRIARERTGICADGSWDRFVEAATMLRDDPRLRDQLGSNGRAYVERVHSLEAVGERWASMLGWPSTG